MDNGDAHFCNIFQESWVFSPDCPCSSAGSSQTANANPVRYLLYFRVCFFPFIQFEFLKKTFQRAVHQGDFLRGAQPEAFPGFQVAGDQPGLPAGPVLFQAVADAFIKGGNGLYFEPLNCSKRATVIVDKNGKVAYAKVQEIKVAREDKDILEALAKLG